ncbi:hypothetical protein QYM36_002190 [Artemia franciscana]|uniref:Uncharacterized protein n=1 Tax=Artemia franciscana TaxID=6661 RepID=A0AA88I6S4_ARTSF|nr:hypothetical protein QYM36_002190 [Artemia franciscana]
MEETTQEKVAKKFCSGKDIGKLVMVSDHSCREEKIDARCTFVCTFCLPDADKNVNSSHISWEMRNR